MKVGRGGFSASDFSGGLSHLRIALSKFTSSSFFLGFPPQEFFPASLANSPAFEDGFSQSDEASSVIAPGRAHLPSSRF
jgi:hypothetical protein